MRKARGNYRDPVQGFFNLLELTDECWIWIGYRDKDGYGAYTPYRKKYRAHRYAYELFIDEIPKGLTIDHLCKITSCVNPEHMEVVSVKENILRSKGPGAINFYKVSCLKGHSLSGDNLYIQNKTGKRYCRTCDRIRGREYEKRKKLSE